jgi:hypothetical protein
VLLGMLVEEEERRRCLTCEKEDLPMLMLAC